MLENIIQGASLQVLLEDLIWVCAHLRCQLAEQLLATGPVWHRLDRALLICVLVTVPAQASRQMRHQTVSRNGRKLFKMLGMERERDKCASQLEQCRTQSCCRTGQSADTLKCRGDSLFTGPHTSPANAGDSKSAHKAAATMLCLRRMLCK